ncbi:hypothetical protein P3668_25210, partial [Vibrio parahaemolyticus]|nr:hypothetical protein [Vibrio parahaemolyticus]
QLPAILYRPGCSARPIPLQDHDNRAGCCGPAGVWGMEGDRDLSCSADFPQRPAHESVSSRQ